MRGTHPHTHNRFMALWILFGTTRGELVPEETFTHRGMRGNMNETKVMISEEWQKVMQKAVR